MLVLIVLLTNASVPFSHQFVVGRTQTLEAALNIGTGTVQARLRAFAFVYVRAISTSTIQFVTVPALTSEHAESVLTLAKHTKIVEHVTLINI